MNTVQSYDKLINNLERCGAKIHVAFLECYANKYRTVQQQLSNCHLPCIYFGEGLAKIIHVGDSILVYAQGYKNKLLSK